MRQYYHRRLPKTKILYKWRRGNRRTPPQPTPGRFPPTPLGAATRPSSQPPTQPHHAAACRPLARPQSRQVPRSGDRGCHWPWWIDRSFCGCLSWSSVWVCVGSGTAGRGARLGRRVAAGLGSAVAMLRVLLAGRCLAGLLRVGLVVAGVVRVPSIMLRIAGGVWPGPGAAVPYLICAAWTAPNPRNGHSNPRRAETDPRRGLRIDYRGDGRPAGRPNSRGSQRPRIGYCQMAVTYAPEPRLWG